MKTQSVHAIVQALNESGVRYLIAGGLAVVAHGYLRFTADVDIVLDLASMNLAGAMRALAALGYTPRAPVAIEAFADPAERQRWVGDKGMTVFSMSSLSHPETEVDLFVQAPLDFEESYAARLRLELAPGVTATFVTLDDLIKMKKTSGRPIDLADLSYLQTLRDQAKQHG